MSSQTNLFSLLRLIFLLKPFDHKAVPTEQRLTWKICFCENEIAKNELQAICCVYWNRCTNVIIANVKKKNVTLMFCIRFVVCMYVCECVCWNCAEMRWQLDNPQHFLWGICVFLNAMRPGRPMKNWAGIVKYNSYLQFCK